MTVGELERRMDAAEFSEWIAFSQIEPLPDSHVSTALICQTVAASGGAKTKLEDFLPYDVEPDYMTPEASSGFFARMLAGRINEA